MYIYTEDDDRSFAAQAAAREAMREREDEIEELKAEISRLKKHINEVESEVAKLYHMFYKNNRGE